MKVVHIKKDNIPVLRTAHLPTVHVVAAAGCH